MPEELGDLAATELVRWIEDQIHHRRDAHARGYQGHVYLYDAGSRRFIVKVASGSGLLKQLRRFALRREYKVYQKLTGFRGSPMCYGLIQDRYLVLEFIEGTALRRATLSDPHAYYDLLLELIQELHRRGVAHADLKRKDNLMVVDGCRPYLIDFGAAIMHKQGFAPINHYLYSLARQFDLNAWVKLKYRGKLNRVTANDLSYYRYTYVERAARAIKKNYLKIKSLFQKTH